MTLLKPDTACRAGRPCYVIVEVGRRYRHNEAAIAHLAQREPWHVEKIEGVAAVTVYRLQPGESPFPLSTELSLSDHAR